MIIKRFTCKTEYEPCIHTKFTEEEGWIRIWKLEPVEAIVVGSSEMG